ncbi:conserved exported protein of unknown function [Bradyrhizobium sp. ORS 285]|uniref:hypothetical protein n=1 Tax=Bradyrhizobium sp. ORS 285 TaxID=115808 RepID=UPI0002406D8C|nr:hypothetical protein [Bradyrhizobium sp. ORS 285]CCD87853.1 conserved exported hypothetical protein [Bradyrhizobium sp. ORS 285]SMX60230.1 conserved exported protein of unknown function [Bradyrhizobium sp. ORS 285]
MAVCFTSKHLAGAIALFGCACSGTASADPIEDVMGGLLRDARSSFARMVPLDLVPTMPSLQPPPIQQPALPRGPQQTQPAPQASSKQPPTQERTAKTKPPPSPAAAAFAAADAAETVADANLDAALAANEKAVAERNAADALAKASPTPANIAAAKAAAEAAHIAEANLTDALLADKETDARLKAARAALAAEQNGRRSQARPQTPMPVSLTDK